MSKNYMVVLRPTVFAGLQEKEILFNCNSRGGEGTLTERSSVRGIQRNGTSVRGGNLALFTYCNCRAACSFPMNSRIFLLANLGSNFLAVNKA